MLFTSIPFLGSRKICYHFFINRICGVYLLGCAVVDMAYTHICGTKMWIVKNAKTKRKIKFQNLLTSFGSSEMLSSIPHLSPQCKPLAVSVALHYQTVGSNPLSGFRILFGFGQFPPIPLLWGLDLNAGHDITGFCGFWCIRNPYEFDFFDRTTERRIRDILMNREKLRINNNT